MAAVVLAGLLGVAGCAGPAGSIPREGSGSGGASPASTSPSSSRSPEPAQAPASASASVSASVEPATTFDLSAHSATDPASPWVVVNKRAPLDPVDFAPRLTTVRGYLVRPAMAPDLEALLRAAEREGVHPTLRSAYRSYGKQAAVYDGWVAQLGGREADEVSARPGHSEHQTGLAVDVGSSTRPGCDFEECFGDTPEGRWVARHAAEYGFLVRYTPANRAVTGYAPESWHLRWVGRDLAEHLRDTGVSTLEEAFGVPGGGYAE